MSHPIPRVERTCLECGTTFLFRPSPSRGTRGKYCSKSCGVRANQTKHGHTTKTSASPTYTSYRNMLARCYQPTSPKYDSYGARGVTVCQRWRDSFEDFLADMGERPAGSTIDRRDGAGNYEPGNCRWATPAAQQSNISTNVWIEFDGQRKVLADWARDLGVDSGVISYRLKNGWALEKALTHRPWGRQRSGEK